ncbi:MAG: methyltransferase domain-containing protein [Elusimicrobia bacterium]|nr:methyltransferase domain-containing protein [Elusimicrobiota bacterium]
MAELTSRTVDRCRICGSKKLHRYLDLGRTPLANSYLAPEHLEEPEFQEDLCIQLCLECGLSQLTKVVHPDRMFRHYLYVSSTTATLREHFAELAATAAKAAGTKPGDLAIDVASNDGCLLSAFKAVGLSALGVDPAQNLAAEANARGLETECAYWSPDMAQKVSGRRGKAKIITACNVFAHADDLHGFMRAVDAALAPDGIFIIECPYLLDFIHHGEFDTAYHEHLSYLGVTPLEKLMAARGFGVFDVERFPDIHGGTVRVYCARAGQRPRTARAAGFFAQEEKFGVRAPAAYDAFAKLVLENRAILRGLIEKLTNEGKTVWAYGASAKGNTLMNFFGLEARLVPKAIDDNPKKWGYFTPGARMAIVGIDALKGARVDYLLLLAWNFESEIRKRCQAAGYQGDFIVPVPKARVVPGRKT